jgi:uncharacterized protein (DUF1015 family)
MATLKPFAALRPRPAWAGSICELPYDVMSSEEARELAAGNDLSFLRVSKPEIDCPPGTDPYSAAVYARGRFHLDRLRACGALQQDAQPHFYLYRQVMGDHAQTGVVAVASCEAYLQGQIKKHELTRPDKEDDRVRHIDALEAQTGPVFLTYRAVEAIDGVVSRETARDADVDFVAKDGIRHSGWVMQNPDAEDQLRSAFAAVPALYIADGHHRCAAAARVFRARLGAGGSAFFLAVIFPHDQMQILPYHRLLHDLHGLSPAAFRLRLQAVMTPVAAGQAIPTAKHEVGVFVEDRWEIWRFRPEFASAADAAGSLDVALLQTLVLGPILAIDDPRTSQRISFVGGIRGTTELERLVRLGQGVAAFSLFPTSMADLMQVADGGGIMPPKSTWFEPKLRDGMFSHLI